MISNRHALNIKRNSSFALINSPFKWRLFLFLVALDLVRFNSRLHRLFLLHILGSILGILGPCCRSAMSFHPYKRGVRIRRRGRCVRALSHLHLLNRLSPQPSAASSTVYAFPVVPHIHTIFVA